MKRLLIFVLVFLAGLSPALSPAAAGPAELQGGGTPLPHPILSETNVRRAVAYCTNKDALIAAAYPELDATQRLALVVDSFFLPAHWAYTQPTAQYPYNPAAGKSLLDSSGWVVVQGREYRWKGGAELVITLSSTGSDMRRAYQEAFQEQMAACGIRVIRVENLFAPLFQRDFEVSAFAWTFDETYSEGLLELYGCDYIPSPLNGWEGQNFSGWCNPAAEVALQLAVNPGLPQAERINHFAAVQEKFAEDVPVLPLFKRTDTSSPGWEHIDFNLQAMFTYANPRSHPVLGEMAVRQAVASCINRDAVLAAAYPKLTPEERAPLLTDTFFFKDYWAYAQPRQVYSYDPSAGQALLDAAGWTIPPTGGYRSRGGQELRLTLTTTDASIRQAYAPILETQLEACGINLALEIEPAGTAFEKINERDFDLAAFAWVYEPEPADTIYETYACGYVPLPVNGMQGSNLSGWCNLAASRLLIEGADTSLMQEERFNLLQVAQAYFAEEVPVVPLFQRPDSSILEHLTLNLDTFKQVFNVLPDVPSLAPFAGYGIYGQLELPVGAVPDPVDLVIKPQRSLPTVDEGRTAISGFSLSVLENDQEQQNYTFGLPVRIKIFFTPAIVPEILNLETLGLYYWDGDSWEDAALTCPVDQRLFERNLPEGSLSANICHLTEFALIGQDLQMLFLPVVRR